MLLDFNPKPGLAQEIRADLESRPGDEVIDLHLWRLGPGHLGAIVSLVSDDPQPTAFYRAELDSHPEISHLTVEVHQRGAAA